MEYTITRRTRHLLDGALGRIFATVLAFRGTSNIVNPRQVVSPSFLYKAILYHFNQVNIEDIINQTAKEGFQESLMSSQGFKI